MRISRTSRFLVSTIACTLVGSIATSVASADSFQGSDRLVRNHRIVGHVKSVLVQDDSGTNVTVDARVGDFTAPTVPGTYRARLVVNLTCADRGSSPTDADHASHIDRFTYRGTWSAAQITSTNRTLRVQPLFTSCPTGQVVELYQTRFQVVDARGALAGLAFVATTTPLLS